jgi:hypothetical protein
MGSFGALEQLYGMMYRETKTGQIEETTQVGLVTVYIFSIYWKAKFN